MVTGNPQSAVHQKARTSFAYYGPSQVDLPGTKPFCFENLSVMVRRASNPSAVSGSPRMKSMVILWYGMEGQSIDRMVYVLASDFIAGAALYLCRSKVLLFSARIYRILCNDEETKSSITWSYTTT